MTSKQYRLYYDLPNDFRQNAEGQRFNKILSEVITPLIKSEIDAGFYPDAILAMVVSAAGMECSEHRMKLWDADYQERKRNSNDKRPFPNSKRREAQT